MTKTATKPAARPTRTKRTAKAGRKAHHRISEDIRSLAAEVKDLRSLRSNSFTLFFARHNVNYFNINALNLLLLGDQSR